MWSKIISGVPQGSVLGPILFLIFINDLPDEIKTPLLMFADDTKLFRKIESLYDNTTLQEDISKLENWCQRWNMKFNNDKCKIMHIGRTNQKFQYKMTTYQGETLIKAVEQEKDLGVTFDINLKFSKHIQLQTNKSNRLMGLIRRSYSFLDPTSFKFLFTSLVRPHLEYCIPVWYPVLKKDQLLIENVLRRASKLIPACKNLPYEERLKMLQLPSMRYRRIRGDMIEAYKFTHKMYDTTFPSITYIQSNTRGHQYKMEKQFCRTNTRLNFFSNRIVNDWNNLPAFIVCAESLNQFKIDFDKFMGDIKYVFVN